MPGQRQMVRNQKLFKIPSKRIFVLGLKKMLSATKENNALTRNRQSIPTYFLLRGQRIKHYCHNQYIITKCRFKFPKTF